MNKIYFEDIATSAFQPIINLSSSPYATLSSDAVTHWIKQDSAPNHWGAFMHFYGPTRKLLKAGGLCIEDKNFLKIVSTNNKWNALISKCLNDNLDTREQLYFVRLLYYLGFYNDGMVLCEKIIQAQTKSEEQIWAYYLKELGKSILNPNNWSIIAFEKEINSLKQNISPFLLFHIYLLCSKFFIRYSQNALLGEKWLNKASALITNSELSNNEQDHFLGLARLQKYAADFQLKFGDKKKAQDLLLNALSLCNDYIQKLDRNDHFLFKETKRRILDALTFYYIRQDDSKKALEIAQKSIQLDPYCSYAYLLAGEVTTHMNPELSNIYFAKAAEYGIIERSYAKLILARDLQVASSVRKNALIQEAIEGRVFLISEKNLSFEEIKSPLELKTLQTIAENYSETTHWEDIKKTETYQRFLPFWELRQSQIDCPLLCQIPLVAAEVFKQKRSPWFQTLYLQRAMPANFREELFFAVSPHSFFSMYHQFQGKQLEILKNRTEELNWLLSLNQTINNREKLERIHFCRLLGSLGFYQEALDKLPLSDRNECWELEDEYAFCTKLFLEHIYFAGTTSFSPEGIDFAFNKLSNRPESLRMRLVLTLLALVYYGKKKQASLLIEWRARGLEVLFHVQNSPHFEDFEKQLLTSRFYRAASFYPFLTNDNKVLRQDAEICESMARLLHPNNERQTLLYQENLFPMNESMARIYYHLGEKELALHLMEEIVNKVDPLDAKAWIQVGEMRERNGFFEKALEAYLMAGSIGAPLGAIAWYRAGRTSEKLNQLKDAKDLYIRSLKFCPRGLSPLKRLKEIAAQLEDPYLDNWCDKNLCSLKNEFGLTVT